jgi:hypothetical protein
VQAAYQVRGMLLGLHGGVKMWCIYDFVDDGTSPTDNEDDFGLVRHISYNYEPKPAFHAIRRVARLMGPDWRIAADVTARLDVDLKALPVPKDVPARTLVTGVPVGSNPRAIRWAAAQYCSGNPRDSSWGCLEEHDETTHVDDGSQ